jgi:hypothetical protein
VLVFYCWRDAMGFDLAADVSATKRPAARWRRDRFPRQQRPQQFCWGQDSGETHNECYRSAAASTIEAFNWFMVYLRGNPCRNFEIALPGATREDSGGASAGVLSAGSALCHREEEMAVAEYLILHWHAQLFWASRTVVGRLSANSLTRVE